MSDERVRLSDFDGVEYTWQCSELVVTEGGRSMVFKLRGGLAFGHNCSMRITPVVMHAVREGRVVRMMACYGCMSAWPDDDGKSYFVGVDREKGVVRYVRKGRAE